MPESLNPTLITRISRIPDWARTALARRVTAGGLVLLAAVAAIRPGPDDARADVVVAARDIGPGTALTAGDVVIENRSAATVPDGAPGDLAAVLGATLAGPARRGEVLTDVRLLGNRLTGAAAGPNARLVPVHPADSALAALLRPGDVVDVVAAGPDSAGDPHPNPRVVATGGIVVLVSDQSHADDRVVLVALPATAANAVAGAALVEAVTLTLR
ncbi:MAG TPA: SAF domain-containing protein [Mycobacterium sp.]|nr:SAF domain-containing protein [Mycobacterium sp.]